MKIFLIIFLIFATGLYAVSTSYFTFENYMDFKNGEFNSVVLSEDGTLSLAPRLDKILEKDEVFIWSFAIDQKGSLYVGTGNDGKIYKIDPVGKTSLFFKTSSVQVTALAVSYDGTLYAGTSPKGIIYKIDQNGKGDVLTILDDSYIWGMDFDSAGTLFAITGNKARLYKFDAQFKPQKIFESTENHFLALVIDKNDNAIISTSRNGIIYKISKEGRSTVLFDADEQEIKCLAIDSKENMYFGTADRESMPQIPQPQFQSPQKDDTQQQGLMMPIKKPLKNSVYKLDKFGKAKKIIESDSMYFLALVADAKDNIYVGTADKAEIYKISPDEIVMKVVSLDASQVMTFIMNKKNEIFLGTGNLGNVYKLLPSFEKEGSYTSEVFDTKFRSIWGKIKFSSSLPDDCELSLQTRSGDKQQPDKTWSSWSSFYKQKDGSDIESPAAKYIQYKINFSTKDTKKTASITKIIIPYLAANQPPEIEDVSVSIPDSSDKSDKDKYRPKLKPFERKIFYKAFDLNNDKLIYKISVQDISSGKEISIADKIEESEYTFDSRMLPDNEYYFKVSVSDSPSNPPDKALETSRKSKIVPIDNTPPYIEDLKYNNGIVTGSAKDNMSKITRIEYSTDTKSWVSIDPEDNVFDSLSERFKFNTQKAEDFIIVKTEDEQGNIGSAKIIIK